MYSSGHSSLHWTAYTILLILCFGVRSLGCTSFCLSVTTKQPLHRRMAQHRRSNTSGPESAVYLHLKDKGHSFEDCDVKILDKEDKWFERGSELDLSVDSCLQMNLVYQQVVQETLDQLETLLTQNHRQQVIKEPPRDQRTSSSYQQPNSLYLGRFLKPYFKDKLTGLVRWGYKWVFKERHRLRGKQVQSGLHIQVDYLSQKLSSAKETDKQQLREQIDSLEREIGLAKKEEELFGDRYEEHDWQKISNIDFEGTKDAEDIRRFWQNFLHPSINKTRWSQEEVQQLEEVSRRHGERHWEIIAQELGTGRTAFMCLQMFQRFISGSLRRSTWSPAEDALLRELVDKMRIGNFIPYTQMSYFMEGRDPAQLIYRWNQVLDPSLKKGPWTKQEDQLLLDAVSRHGEKNWWKIRLEVPGRTDSACRDRYLDCLKEGIKRGAFDKRERDLLLQLVKKHGVGQSQILHNSRNSLEQKPRSQAGKKKASPARRRIRRRLVKVKEEEESTEEEEMVVHYMDSDEDEKKEILEVKRKEKEEEEVENEEVEKEEEEEYILPPMEEWIPSEKEEHFNFLRFQSVVLPSSADVSGGKLVRSTIAGKFGRSVITGPSPRVLKWEEHHSSNTMMMVSPDQLRAYFLCKANKFNRRGRVTEMGLGYELQAAVTPWIGNLLIPAKSRLTAADSLRERGEKTQLTSTSVFMLFLQTMNIDTTGCKEMIEQRRNNVVLLTPPPDPSSVQIKNPHTVAGMLQQKRVIKEELDTQILDQLQFFQHQGNTCLLLVHLLLVFTSPQSDPSFIFFKFQAEAKMKRLSSSSPCKKRRRKSRCQDKVQVPAQPMTQLPGLCLRPGQSMWVMTPSGLLQLAEAPSQGLQLALVPTAPLPPSPGHILSPTTPRPPVPLTSGGYRLVAPKPPAVCVPVNVPNQNQPPTCSSISLPPTCVLQPVPNPISSPAPSWSSAPPVPPNVFLPYKGTVRVDPADPPSFRRETLQFDPSLMFFESQEEVRDWLSGRGGVVVSGTDAALPYLPPFVSSLSTLSALLRAKKSLTKSSLQLLSEGSKRRHPQTKPRRDSNPAYQLLKARFLSCFTLPALMATIQPITATTLAPEDSQEEEEEEEEKEKEEDEEVVELKKIKERGRRRRSEVSPAADDSKQGENSFCQRGKRL
uniref:Small nuclear RNA activating complex, polypeptide 4 n=1 Tax=Anabas testudineus TaxID=64144 RepID=A0A3Q1INW1_ANATE